MRLYNLLAIGFLVFSCAPTLPNPVNQASTVHHVSGVVLGEQVVPHAIVIIADPSTANKIALTYTDVAGRFSLETSESKVSLATVTNDGWAYLPSIDTNQTDLQITLNRSCISFHGQIVLDDPAPTPRVEFVTIGGFTPNVYGLFGVVVANDLSFDACLPADEYYITLPPNFAERTVLTMVPPAEPLKVHAVTQKYSMTPPPVPLNVPDESRDEMVANLPNSVRLLGMAESNHGTADYMKERVDLSVALARQHHFSIVMIEAGYGESIALDDYIKGANIQIDEAINDIGYWMWNTRDFRAALDKLRTYNATVSSDAQISIVGIDMQSTKGALSELERDWADAPSVTVLPMLLRLGEKKGKAWLDFTSEEKALARTTLEQLAAERDLGGIGSPRNRRALAARSILLRLDLLEQDSYWNRSRVRDRGMAQMAFAVLSLNGRLRGSVWAHLAHLSREFVVGATTMGSHLTVSLGDGYQVWALLGVEGAARARSAKRNGEVVEHPLSPAPAYSVEGVLSRSSGARGLSVGYWDLRRKVSPGPWLRGLRWLREIGAAVLENRGAFDLYDLNALDGIVLFRHINPSEPLAPASPVSTPSR